MPRRFYILVAAAALLAHVGAFGGQFTFDDHVIVEKNPTLIVRGVDDARHLLFSNWWGGGGDMSGERLWRPTALVSLALDRAILGPGPDGFRATNVAFHALASLLALALFARVTREPAAALLGALFFAVHPVHAEAVAGVVGRAEVLALLFSLVAILAHVRAREAAGGLVATWRLLAGVAFLLALGSKESAVATPAILLVVELLAPPARGDERLSPRALLLPYGVFVLALAVYLAGRKVALTELFPLKKAQTIGALPLETRALVATQVTADAIGTVLLPRGTAAHYPFTPPALLEPRTLAVLLVHALVLGAVALAVRRGGRAARAAAAGTVAFYLALGPVSNLIPIGVVQAERLLYAPSCWAALCLGVVGLRGARAGREAPTAAGIVLLGLALGLLAAHSNRNDRLWGSDERLWRATVERFPGEGRPHLALGEELLARGDHDAAAESLRLAVERLPEENALRAKAFALYGEALAMLGRDREADAALDEALRRGPTNQHVRIAKARALLARNRPREAIEHTAIAVASWPTSYEAHLWHGTVLLRAGEFQQAIAVLDRATILVADPLEARFNRGQAREMAGDLAGALDDYRYVVARKPAFQDGVLALAEALLKAHQVRDALGVLSRADGSNPDVVFLKGVGLLYLNRTADARSLLEAALPGLTGERRAQAEKLLEHLRR
jgi:tetratricopeptide (TPR) repeat protein